MQFKSNCLRFKRDYEKLFKNNPEGANLLLLIFELAGQKDKVITDATQLGRLMAERFDDPARY